jgi:hypothetical protein
MRFTSLGVSSLGVSRMPSAMRNLDQMLDRLRALPADRALDQLEFAVWERISRSKSPALSLWPSGLTFNVATAAGALVIGLLTGVYSPQYQTNTPAFDLVDQSDLVGGGLLQQAM